MDERDDSLARLYRRASREEPPARIDLAVMEMARRSSRRRAWSLFGNHWLATGAVAAVALVSVVLLMQGPSTQTVLPESAQGDAARRVPDVNREQDDGAVRLPLPPPGKRLDSDMAGADPALDGAKHEKPATRVAQSGEGQALQAGAAEAQPHGSGPPQPRFDFYKTLPEMTVDVPPPEEPSVAVTPRSSPSAAKPAEPAPESATSPRMTSPVPAVSAREPAPSAAAASATERAAGEARDTPAAPAAGYFLQVGAFRAADAAARFRNRLAALDLPASIEAIALANRETWHRVRVGPYPDMAAVEAVRARLKAQGIDSMLVKTAD